MTERERIKQRARDEAVSNLFIFLKDVPPDEVTISVKMVLHDLAYRLDQAGRGASADQVTSLTL